MLKKIKSKINTKSRQRMFIFLCVIVIVFLMIIASRIWSAIALHYQTNKRAIPIVATITAASAPSDEDVILPGNVEAWHEAPVYARTNGYIKKWYVDIGAQVKEGELLAVIETPELDAQLRQAEANLNVVLAQNKLAQSTAARWLDLLKSDSVSKQETDEKVNSAHALEASVIAAKANLVRLQELVGFERIIAPFAGTISARATDIGALINAGNNQSDKPLFRIVQTNPLRVYVKIPQSYASVIKPNMVVTLQFPEHPGQSFPAKLLKTAGAIDPTSRTLLAQFIVDNKNGELIPGSYTEVHFKMPTSAQMIRLPVNTLIFRAEGLQVATLDQNNEVVLKSITVNRDFGSFVEVRSGIKLGEHIIINPPDSIFNGEKVQVNVSTSKNTQRQSGDVK
jgi:RND family efflux transporter MFP subunit